MTKRTPAKQQVIKDFSELRPVNERIEMLAAGIYQIVFRGEADEDFRPKKGTQIERAWRMRKLDARQQIAWQTFMDDVTMAAGKSGGVCSPYGEQINKGDGDEFKIPVAYTNDSYRTVEQILMHFLSWRERALLIDLIQDSLRGNSSLQIETIGLVRSGYADKVSARASGVTRIQTLLDRLADYYGV